MTNAHGDCFEVALKWLAVLLAILFCVTIYWLLTDQTFLNALIARLAL